MSPYTAGMNRRTFLTAIGLSALATPLGAEAAQLFSLYVNSGHGAKDFSGIIRMLDGK